MIAVRLLAEVLCISPDHIEAQHLKEELDACLNQADQLYREIDMKLEGGDLAELTELAKEAINIYPEHPSGRIIQTRLAARAKQFREAMEEGLRALQGMGWEDALQWFQEALKLHSGVLQLRRIIAELSQIEDIRKKIDLALVHGNFDEAQRLACFVDQKVEQIEGRITT